MKNRTEISTVAERRLWLKDYITKNPQLTYDVIRKEFVKRFERFSSSTLYRDFTTVRREVEGKLRERMEAREKIMDELELTETKKIIKTKTQRLLEYQGLVADCLTDLSTGTTRDTYFDKTTGKPKNYRRPMTIFEYNQTRRTLKEIQVEISKIEGDYAPEKQSIDHTTKGDKLSGPVVWEFVDAKKKE